MSENQNKEKIAKSWEEAAARISAEPVYLPEGSEVTIVFGAFEEITETVQKKDGSTFEASNVVVKALDENGREYKVKVPAKVFVDIVDEFKKRKNPPTLNYYRPRNRRV
jgi:predicted DNA-binding antitoxin AbrB/MazE fold protein